MILFIILVCLGMALMFLGAFIGKKGRYEGSTILFIGYGLVFMSVLVYAIIN